MDGSLNIPTSLRTLTKKIIKIKKQLNSELKKKFEAHKCLDSPVII